MGAITFIIIIMCFYYLRCGVGLYLNHVLCEKATVEIGGIPDDLSDEEFHSRLGETRWYLCFNVASFLFNPKEWIYWTPKAYRFYLIKKYKQLSREEKDEL